jgi:ABC-type branched-subunit amino acid transport system ATPase component
MLGSPAVPEALASGVRPDLQAERVSKRYGSFTAVDDLSLEVARGSFFSILGPSGCGKTTLLRMIAGLETASSGTIVQNGVDLLPGVEGLPFDARITRGALFAQDEWELAPRWSTSIGLRAEQISTTASGLGAPVASSMRGKELSPPDASSSR